MACRLTLLRPEATVFGLPGERSLVDSGAGRRGGCASFRGSKKSVRVFGASVRRPGVVKRTSRPVVENASSSNSGGGGSRGPSGGGASEDELKVQLDALQEEALHVRARYNAARSRFMRLTEAAQQLRHRADVDIGLGDEDGARKALTEKQKVIRAAELSKKRAQLLEELSGKLGEAISRKETALIHVLSISPQLSSSDKAVTVRAVPPREERHVSSDGGAEARAVAGTFEGFPNRIDTTDRGSADSAKAMDSSAEQGQPDQAEDLSILDDGKEVEKSARDHEAEDKGLALARKEAAGEANNRELQSESGLLSEDYMDGSGDLGRGASEILDRVMNVSPDEGNFQDSRAWGHSNVEDSREVAAQLMTENFTAPRREGPSGKTDASREVTFYDGGHLLFEDYVLDVDHQVAAAESKLRIFMATAVSGNADTGDDKMQLVGELLDQVQSIRARIAEIVRLFHKEEMQ